MKNTNLNKVEKDLRYLAKRYKSIKYSLGLAILFLMMGVSAFSEEVAQQEVPTAEQISTSKENLKGSLGNLQTKIDTAKKENEKSLAGLKLELIQLMEQGDRVVKMPWSSWQYGVGYTYNSWGSEYRGRGDKKAIIGVQERLTGSAKYTQNSNNGEYSLTSLNLIDTAEPDREISVSAGIRPKNVNKEAPTMNLPTINSPRVPSLNVSLASPEAIPTPSINSPNINPVLPTPNTSPFSDFGTHGLPTRDATTQYAYGGVGTPGSFAQNYGVIDGGEFWSGVKENGEYAEYSKARGMTVYETEGGTPISFDVAESNVRRLTGLNFLSTNVPVPLPQKPKVRNIKAHVRGGIPLIGYAGYGPYTGTSAFTVIKYLDATNIEFNLYGKAAAISLEAQHSPKVTFTNSVVNVHEDNNTLFNIVEGKYYNEGDWDRIKVWTIGASITGFIKGNNTININTKNNSVYAIAGFTKSFSIINTGKITLNGASNVVVSDLGHISDGSKYVGTGPSAGFGAPPKLEAGDIRNYIPLISLSTPIEQYGDENITLFFNTMKEDRTIGNGSGNIGIYQGEISVKAKIGEKLNSAGTNLQTVGNLSIKNGKATGYATNKVDANVGVYAISGQRTGIIPSTNLLANDYNNKDTIHNLEVGNFDFRFGKYSKNGVMFLSGNGTAMDIGKSTTVFHIGSTSDKFTDGINGENTTEANASQATIIAYSKGVWRNNNVLDSKGNVIQRGHGLAGNVSGLEGKSSEINIYIPLTMISKEGIAYLAEDSGKVNVLNRGGGKANSDTIAKGYKSLVAHAKNYGEINIAGKITATDSGVSSFADKKYQNIAAYAKQDETNASNVTKDTSIVVNGNVTVNGIAALADGIRTKVELKGTANLVNTSRDGGLVAKNKGQIVFVGGTINNKNNKTDVNPTTGAILKDANGKELNDHKNTVPFYADNGSKITFGNSSPSSKTTINMYDGILVFGKAADYDAGYTSTTARYFGMGKVTVELKANGVNLGVFEEINPTWNGSDASYLAVLKTVPKFAAINNPNGYRYKSTLIKGTLTINTNINLTSASDKFNDILMERERVVINAGKIITGNGKGLSMGSNKNATANTESGYTNRGTVNISGGTTSKGVAGINVSYGNIVNDTTGIVSVNIGAGLYATNDSKVENKGTINITGSGTGIAVKGIADKQEKNKAGKLVTVPAFNYGNIGKIEIINTGKINVAGNNAIGIYAHNNRNAAQNLVKITNNSSLSLGNNGVGILLKGNGGLINLGGNSTIKVGTNGIGVYGEKAVVTLNTNQTIETKENGVGIYTSGTSRTVGGKTLTYKYTGANNKTGIATLFAGTNSQNNLNIQLNNSTNITGGMVGIFVSGGGTFNNTGNIIGSTSAKEAGIISENTNIVNSGKITLSGNPTSLNNTNVAIYSKTANSITNSGDISVGKNSIGIYGHRIVNTANITVGDKSIATYSKSGNVNLSGNITIGKNEAVALFTSGNNQNITTNANLSIGDGSYAYVIKGNRTSLTINSPSTTVGNNTVFAYSSDKNANIVNNTSLTSTGKNNYGLYTSGYTENNADINFASSTGNVGIYVTDGGRAINNFGKTITVGGSDITDPANSYYGIGMAAGYQNTKKGTIENKGTIRVTKDNSIGMYASGSGSKAINNGTIELSGNKTVGMYLDNNAVGENHGTIKTVPSPDNKGIIGVVALNGAVIKNYGDIIINAPNGIGVFHKGGLQEQSGSTISAPTRTQTTTQAPTGKGVKGIDIKAPAGVTTAQVVRNGVTVNPLNIDTTISSPEATQVRVGNTTLNIRDFNLSGNIGGASSEIGMYVDTSGVRYTNPIKGLSNIRSLERINLIFGTEASRYTSAKDIVIGQNILKPYNDAIVEVTRTGSGETKWLLKSNSLTWIATGTQSSNDTFAKVYLSKIPYTSFAKDTDTYNFMNGLEQRYGVESIGSRERSVFDKLNELGKGEGNIFAQAIDEMKGNQYANIEQRVYSTLQILDKEFTNLGKDWKTLTKNSNKLKTFGSRGEYKTNTAGIVDYTNNAYGLVYIKENEDIKLGKSVGWYAGFVYNKFKFKDIGRSKEDMLQGKVGLYKSVPFDDNDSLNWTVSGDISLGYNKMNRKFLVVDEIFNAKSKYYTYGVGIKNEIGKEFRLSEDFSLRPYGALKLEYGRISKIKEKSGEINLDVKEKNYVSVKPEVGTELMYKHYFGAKTLKVGLGVAYENELGKVANNDTKVKVANTTADWYNLRAEKEDRKGNVKTDLTVGFDNQMYGVTANVGYDTKGENVRGGLGLRVIF